MATLNKEKVIFLSIAGTLIEWADYAIYGYMASRIAGIFFPQQDKVVALISAFAIFAFGFLVRPLGALVFGHVADRRGRKTAILATMLLMAFATMAMGLLPSYQAVGVWAPILLLFARLLQSLAVAGENGVATFIVEHAKRYPSFASSFIGSASAAGLLLGAALVGLCNAFITASWSWRLPYLISSIACFAIYFGRKRMAESPQFTYVKQHKQLVKVPIWHAMRSESLGVLQTATFAAFMGIFVYICSVYFNAFVQTEGHLIAHQANLAVTLGQVFAMMAIPLAGLAAEFISGIALIFTGLLLTVIGAPCMFWLASLGQLHYAILAQGIYALCIALTLGPMFRIISDSFKTQVRYSAYAFSWNLTVSVLGGSAPMVATLLTQRFNHYAAGFYVAAVALVSFVVLVFVRARMGAVADQSVMYAGLG